VVAFIIPVLVALMAFLLWTFFVNLILRSLFGLPLPLSPFDYRNRKTILQFLTLSQSVIYGVLHFGCGMVIMTTLSRYLNWRYFHGSSSGVTQAELFRSVWEWIFGGVLVGLLSFFSGSHVRSK